MLPQINVLNYGGFLKVERVVRMALIKICFSKNDVEGQLTRSLIIPFEKIIETNLEIVF